MQEDGNKCTGHLVAIRDSTPAIHIFPPNGEQGSIVSIHKDGTVTFGPDFTTSDEASKVFWSELGKFVRHNL